MDVLEKLYLADRKEDWREVVKWCGRMEELLQTCPNDICSKILDYFVSAHITLCFRHSSVSEVLKLAERRFELLAKMERCRDQGEAMHKYGVMLLAMENRRKDAAKLLERSRKVNPEP